MQLDAYEPVVRYVHSILRDGKNGRKYKTGPAMSRSGDAWTMSITGHSLGGGISTIVGSTLSIPVITFLFCIVY